MIFRAALILTFSIAVTLTSGCATRTLITAVPCQGLDWFEIGRRDGAIGKPLSGLNQHIEECANGEPPNTDLYVNGRNAGLVDFCTNQSGFEIGRSGTPYMAVCPEHLEKRFLPGYEQGQRVFRHEEQSASRNRRSL